MAAGLALPAGTGVAVAFLLCRLSLLVAEMTVDLATVPGIGVHLATVPELHALPGIGVDLALPGIGVNLALPGIGELLPGTSASSIYAAQPAISEWLVIVLVAEKSGDYWMPLQMIWSRQLTVWRGTRPFPNSRNNWNGLLLCPCICIALCAK